MISTGWRARCGSRSVACTTAHPNPRVGCVLVRDDELVAEGWHVRTGGRPRRSRGAEGRRGGGARLPPPTSRSNPAATRGAHRPVRRRWSRPASPGWSSARPIPTRGGRRRHRGAARGRHRCAYRRRAGVSECAALNAGFNQRMTSGRPLGAGEAGASASMAEPRSPTAPASGSAVRPRAPMFSAGGRAVPRFLPACRHGAGR